jgi:hypothetical protein
LPCSTSFYSPKSILQSQRCEYLIPTNERTDLPAFGINALMNARKRLSMALDKELDP